MATICQMIVNDLPPVGNKILTKPSSVIPTFPGFSAYYVDSGTSALALAIIAAKQLQPSIKKPEVIVPAYCCPDLVSAVIYAGATAVAIDIDKDDPSYNLDALNTALGGNTIAVIAVNFLGIKERLTQIKEQLPNHCLLIEDNAQSFEPLEKPEQLAGDVVITSFGKGKPISTLGGGLCLIKKPLDEYIALNKWIEPEQKATLLTTKIHLYNCLISPRLYSLINRNPFLAIGETHYKEKKLIHAIDKQRLQWLDKNIQAYQNQSTTPQNKISKALSSNKTDFKRIIEDTNPRMGKLLRYPILCQSKQARDELYYSLDKKGLGVSKLYQKEITKINGLPHIKCMAPIKNATNFSERLITLPCHQSVDQKHLEAIQNFLSG